MPQAAVRIAPSLLAASAGLGAEARAVAGAGPRLRRGPRTFGRPDERTGAALLDVAKPVAMAENAPGFRGAVVVVSTGPGFGGRSLPESRLPKIDEAGHGAALRGSA